MKKQKANKRAITLISLLASFFIFFGAITVYLYANGWRVDPFNQQFIKTGVLTVESEPFLADLYIDGKSKGKTPKSTSLNVGEYDISVKKNGYREWKKKVEIKEEKSTPVFPWLVKQNIAKSNAFTIEGKDYINSWFNGDRDHLLILTKTYDETTLLFNYELWSYNVNTTFWDLSSNPKVILTFQSTTDPNITLLQSPNGLSAVLRYSLQEVTITYLLDISKTSTLDQLTVLNIEQFSTYEMTWARNNRYLMFESDSDLISFNIDRQSRYLLIKKELGTEYLWSTDEQGYFYTVESALDNENEKVYAYILTQEEMDGSNPKILVSDLFFQKNKDFLTKYREEDLVGKYSAFTNSTASTKSVGKIVDIMVNQNAQGIYIQTDSSSYWYNIRTKRYYLISPYKSELVQFSPDNRKLIYKDEKEFGVFTFLKEEGNSNIEIGSKMIKDISIQNSQILGWLSNSLYIEYTQDNNVYIADKEGENKSVILEGTDIYKHLGVTYSKDNLFTLSVIEANEGTPMSISIDRYSIH